MGEAIHDGGLDAMCYREYRRKEREAWNDGCMMKAANGPTPFLIITDRRATNSSFLQCA